MTRTRPASVEQADAKIEQERVAYNEWLHPQSQAFDAGHRAAIRNMLEAVTALAERQVRRSAHTAARRPPANWIDSGNANHDVAVHRLLSTMLETIDSLSLTDVVGAEAGAAIPGAP